MSAPKCLEKKVGNASKGSDRHHEKVVEADTAAPASSKTSAIDVAAWVGNYPFRGIRRAELADLNERMDELNIERVIVASFDEIFQENNLEAAAAWSKRLADHPRLEHWPVINPSQPGQLEAMEKWMDQAGPRAGRGIRLTPNYHGYRLLDQCVAELMDLARRRGLAVQVFQRIADERWHWILHTEAVPIHDLLYFTTMWPDQPMVLSAVSPLAELAGRLGRQENLVVDISRVRGPVFAIERLIEQVDPRKIVFGSLWPIQIIEATLWQVREAAIAAPIQRGLLRENFAALMTRCGGA